MPLMSNKESFTDSYEGLLAKLLLTKLHKGAAILTNFCVIPYRHPTGEASKMINRNGNKVLIMTGSNAISAMIPIPKPKPT